MTQPDGFLPALAADFISFAAWAAKTQADWEAIIRDPIDTVFGDLLAGFFQGLQQGISFVLSILTAVAKSLLNFDPTTFFATVDDALAALETVGGVFVGGLATVVGQISDIFTGAAVTAVNSTVQQVKDWWTDVGNDLPAVAAKAVGLVDGIVQAGANDLSLVGQAVGDAVNVVTQILTAAPQQLLGAVGGGIAGFFAALGAHKTSTVQTQAQVVQVAAALNTLPTAGGTDVTVDFTAMANASTMSGVMSPGAGPMGITSGQAQLQSSTGSTTATELFSTLPTSPYIVIEVTLGSLNDLGWSITPQLSIVFRSNSSRTSLSRLTIYASGVGSWPAGTGTPTLVLSGGANTIGSAYLLPSLAQDGVLKIIIGDRNAGNPYVYEVVYNNTVVIPPTPDGSHFSDATQFYVGLQQLSSAAGKYPPGVKKIRYYDNAPTAGPRPFSGRPANNPDQPGALYSPSDVGGMWRDNGTSYDNLWIGPRNVATTPYLSGWSQPVTMSPATVAADLDGRMLIAPSALSDFWRLDMRTLSPTSSYACRAYIELSAQNGNYVNAGLVLRDSVSGKLIYFGPAYNSGSGGFGLAAIKYTNPTTAAGSPIYTAKGITDLGGIPNWLTIVDDGANRYFQYSFNGVDWIPFGSSTSRTDFITPDQIGWGANNNNTGNSITARLRSFAGVS